MPDAYFGEKGKEWIDLGGGQDIDPVVKHLADGKILLVGAAQEDTVKGVVVVRLLSNGLRDKHFGRDGRVFVALAGKITAMAVQADGKILLAGYEFNGKNDDFALIRLTASGQPDLTFNAIGKKRIHIEGSEQAQNIWVQPDGRIVLAGFSYDESWSDRNFAVVRLNADGSADATFGFRGTKTVDVARYDHAAGLWVQPDGQILVAGHSRSETFNEFVAFRLDAQGNMDMRFGREGVFRRHVGKEHDHCAGIQVTDQRIFLAGHTKTGGMSRNFDFAVLALHMNGQADTAFGKGGVQILDAGGVEYATDLLMQPDGNLLVTGSSSGAFAVARFTRHGKPDPAFGVRGVAQLEMKGVQADFATSAQLQPDGKILLAGRMGSGAVLARLEGNPYLPGLESVLAFDWQRPVSQVGSSYMRMNLAPGFSLQAWMSGDTGAVAATASRGGGKSLIPVEAAIQRHAYFALGSELKMTVIWDLRGGIHYYAGGVYLKTEASIR